MTVRACTLLSLILAGCGLDVAEEQWHGQKIPDQPTNEVLEAARADFAREDYDRVVDFCQYIAETRPEARELDEARLLAADALLAQGEPYKSFQQLKLLIEERPFSQHRPEVEEREFQIGVTLFQDEPGFFGDAFTERGHGVDVLTHFATTFARNPNADDALRLAASYYFDKREWALAIDQYGRLYNEHPDSEWRELAHYRIGLCHSRWVPGSDYDRTHMLMARQAFRSYLDQHPDGNFKNEVTQELGDVEERLARKELDTARFYVLRGSKLGARLHLTNAVLAYPSTPSAAQARALLDEFGFDLSVSSLDTLELKGRSFTDPLQHVPDEPVKKKGAEGAYGE
ncbi:MAG: outer membrane protein assembly factor BamD [Planctomycetota bacterium]